MKRPPTQPECAPAPRSSLVALTESARREVMFRARSRAVVANRQAPLRFNNEPVINGLRLVEEWDRGITDYVDANGSGTIYSTYLMKNGDKCFPGTALLVQTDSGMQGIV